MILLFILFKIIMFALLLALLIVFSLINLIQIKPFQAYARFIFGLLVCLFFYFTFGGGFLLIGLALVVGTYFFQKWYTEKIVANIDRFGTLHFSIIPFKTGFSFQIEVPLFILMVFKHPWLRSMAEKSHQNHCQDPDHKEHIIFKLITENVSQKEPDETKQILWMMDHLEEFIRSLEDFSINIERKQVSINIYVK